MKHQLVDVFVQCHRKNRCNSSNIENGIIEIDDQLKTRITDLKAEREIIRVSIDRIAHHASNRTQITPERIEAFSKLMNEKLQNGDVQAKKAYLRSVISVIEVDDKIVRIFGDKTQLAAALSEQNERTGKVRGFVRKWCRLGAPDLYLNAYPVI